MKKYLLFLIFTSCCFSQIKSGNVTYNYQIGYDQVLSNDAYLKNMTESAQIGAKKISFNLEFNSKSSLFKLNDYITDDDIDLAIAFSNATTSYFYDIILNVKTMNIDNFTGQYIVNYFEKTPWKIENETKYIGEYLCYKATAEQIVENSKGTFKHPITAWYCPSIPFNFGPKGYSDLPGLILELQIRNITWGATRIELSNENKIIEKPTKGRLITEEEYKKLLSSPILLRN